VEIARVRASHEKETTAIKAKLNRAELQVSTLERTLQSKEKENEELTKICDGLLAQVEGS